MAYDNNLLIYKDEKAAASVSIAMNRLVTSLDYFTIHITISSHEELTKFTQWYTLSYHQVRATLRRDSVGSSFVTQCAITWLDDCCLLAHI